VTQTRMRGETDVCEGLNHTQIANRPAVVSKIKKSSTKTNGHLKKQGLPL